jgi:hypothetical protein
MNIAIISGASSGIGLEFAKLCDSENLDEIWLIARNEEKLNALSKTIKTKSKILPYDLCDFSCFEKIKKCLEDSEAKIKYLICSAGVGFNGKVENISEKNIEKTINLNCSALSVLTKICLPFMYNGSKIIEIASGAGFMPQPNFSVYAASKAYVISFSRALRQELKPKKINVCAVCPGPVDTQFFASLDGVKEYKKKFVIPAEKVAKGALKSAKKGKALYSPTFSMKMAHFASKLLPTSLILNFYK